MGADYETDRICPSPNCEYDKHEPNANFCMLCGTLLYQRCEDCRAENPKYARFCLYCGTDLAEVPDSTQQEDPEDDSRES